LSIWKLQCIAFKEKWWVSGVVLHGGLTPLHSDDSAFKTFLKTAKTYFSRPFEGRLKMMLPGSTREVSVGKDGAFSLFTQDLNPGAIRFQSMSDKTIPVSQSYPIIFDRARPVLTVISDIDDTILISKSSKFFSKLWLMLFRQTSKRNFVDESEKAYRIFKNKNIPFFYVSASEANLFGTIANFLEYHDLPIGPIFLRPFNRWNQLLKRPERLNYKEERIKEICSLLQGCGILLFGDDSQDDPEVFRKVLHSHPSDIKGIFIRRTGTRKGSELKNSFGEPDRANMEVFHYDRFAEIEEVVNKLANGNLTGN
jgi:phosphatidate phosphatase APP1